VRVRSISSSAVSAPGSAPRSASRSLGPRPLAPAPHALGRSGTPSARTARAAGPLGDLVVEAAGGAVRSVAFASATPEARSAIATAAQAAGARPPVPAARPAWGGSAPYDTGGTDGLAAETLATLTAWLEAAAGGDAARAAALAVRIGALPLEPGAGTPFEQRVRAAIRSIPPGVTRTYGALAAALGMPNGARAVARACAANPLALLVPCHRVVPASGGPGGYRWAGWRKRLLLEWEQSS